VKVFQTKCEAAVDRVYATHGIEPLREMFRVKEDASLGSEAGDVYVRHRFRCANAEYEVFIYADEAGYFRNGVWRIFETQDYSDPEALVQDLVAALDLDLLRGSRLPE
jgi:hypothetical protein